MNIQLNLNQLNFLVKSCVEFLTFNQALELFAAKSRFNMGAYRVYIDFELLKHCIDQLIIKSSSKTTEPMFWGLCEKALKIIKKEDDPKKTYGILFDVGENKIRSIKAYRELLRNNDVINMMGRTYDCGLGTVKSTVEANVVLGPLSKDDIKTVETILKYMNIGVVYKVVEIKEGMETLAKDHKKYIWEKARTSW